MTAGAAKSRSLIRRLYDWCMDAAGKPHAVWTLGAVSFAESSFFPAPPDIILIPMALAQPQRAYRYAAWCTLASVAGGALGYGIGALLYDLVGLWLISALRLRRQGRSVPPSLYAMGRLDHSAQRRDPDPL